MTLLLGSGCRQCSMMGSGLLCCCAVSSRDSAPPELLVPLLVLWDACHLRSTTHHHSATKSFLSVTDQMPCSLNPVKRSPPEYLASEPALLPIQPVLQGCILPVQHQGLCLLLQPTRRRVNAPSQGWGLPTGLALLVGSKIAL